MDDIQDGSAIDLGQSPMTEPIGTPTPDKPDNAPMYPSMSIDSTNPAIMNLPDEGHALIKYKVHRRETSDHTHGKSKRKRYSIGMHVHSIKPHKTKKKRRSTRLPGAAEDEAAVDAGL